MKVVNLFPLSIIQEKISLDKIKPLKERRWLKELAEEGLEEGIQEIGEDRIFIAPSCSLLHSPVDLDSENDMDDEMKSQQSCETAASLREGGQHVREKRRLRVC